MLNHRTLRRLGGALCLLALLAPGCAGRRTQTGEPRVTRRDKTAKGAAIGAGAGALFGALIGEREADEILAGAAIGAGVGAGVGAYMDRQEEKLAHIPGTRVERAGRNLLLVHFDSDVLFEVDSAVLGPQARSSLDQVAQVFQQYPKTAVVIQGHTDSTGTEEHNQTLSERRARAVEGYLIAKGVNGKRMTSVGYGEGHPVAPNDTARARAKNRRVDMLLKAKAT